MWRPFDLGVLKLKGKKIWLVVIGVVLLSILSWVLALSPSHDRDWLVELNELPNVTLGADFFRISAIRDWSYDQANVLSTDYRTAAFAYKDLKNVWFVVEPFEKSDKIAHTMLIFEFAGDQLLGVSVEARREEGEKYSAWSGLWNKYELIYVWANGQDLLTRRGVYLNHDIFMYRLDLDKMVTDNLLRSLLTETKAIAETPRFYNTLLSNCTNELAKQVGLPWNWSFIFTGTSDRYLYEKKIIPNVADFETQKNQANIAEWLRANYTLKLSEFNARLLEQFQ